MVAALSGTLGNPAVGSLIACVAGTREVPLVIQNRTDFALAMPTAQVPALDEIGVLGKFAVVALVVGVADALVQVADTVSGAVSVALAVR